MRTVKEVSQLTGISIRTLRYYDEIGLLKPARISENQYRLYDDKALEKLQEIMFFKEMDIPLETIKKLLENPELDRKEILLFQKALLERKRNRLNGIIELIEDVREGVNTMSFEAFSEDDIERIVEHTIENIKPENARYFLLQLADQIEKNELLGEATDKQYGMGVAMYFVRAIREHYGII